MLVDFLDHNSTLGVGSDGRTSLLHRLKRNSTPTSMNSPSKTLRTTATIGVSMDVVHYKKTKIILCDCPGSEKMRELWKV